MLLVMKIFVLLCVLCLIPGRIHADEYLRKVLDELATVESASYREAVISLLPYDTLSKKSCIRYVQEYRNPKDTAIGASFVTWSDCDSVADFLYDGEMKAHIEQDAKEVVIDDFTARKLPFRPVSAPFFNYTESILDYFLTSTDSIVREIKDCDSSYYVKMTICEDTQVEFFGKAFRMPESPFYIDPVSVYEIWINKRTCLPYQVKRTMSTQVTMSTCSDIRLNQSDIADFTPADYFPEGYAVRKWGDNCRQQSIPEGEKAPGWKLENIGGEMVALDSIKSRVILLNLTGIGCGACLASVPFLRTLEDRFSPEDFKLVAIETWGNPMATLQGYAEHTGINYTFLKGDKDIVDDYKTGGAAPFFFFIGENRVVRKVLKGYSIKNTGKEIVETIEELLE